MPTLKPKFESTKISISTLITAIDNDASIMVNGDRIAFNFTKLTTNDIEQKVSMNEFRTMKKLGLIFDSNRPVGWILFISMFINLTTITHIGLAGTNILNGDSGIVADIKNLLQQTCNVYSLNIRGFLLNQKSCLTADHICSMIPIHVRQLEVSIKNLNEVKIVLQRLKHLSSAKFIFDETPSWSHFHEWFKINKQNMSYQTDRFSLLIWFKKNNNVQSNNVEICNKRIKLTDDHHGS
jgi:predicted NUDIX family phosphoesterase